MSAKGLSKMMGGIKIVLIGVLDLLALDACHARPAPVAASAKPAIQSGRPAGCLPPSAPTPATKDTCIY
jgi:hypothetical protein